MKNIIKKIKEHFEYIRNRRIVKRECAKILSNTLPMIGQVSTNGANIFKFILRLLCVADKPIIIKVKFTYLTYAKT